MEEKFSIHQIVKVRLRYPNKLPVKLCSKSLKIDQQYFLIPTDMTVGQFKSRLLKHIKMNPEEGFYLLIDNVAPTGTQLLSRFDNKGLIIVDVEKENIFGQ